MPEFPSDTHYFRGKLAAILAMSGEEKFNSYSNATFKTQSYKEAIGEDGLNSLRRYLYHGIRPGAFLSAVIQNDLKEACGRADDNNLRILHHWVAFLYNFFPIAAWGDHQRMNDFLKLHREVEQEIERENEMLDVYEAQEAKEAELRSENLTEKARMDAKARKEAGGETS